MALFCCNGFAGSSVTEKAPIKSSFFNHNQLSVGYYNRWWQVPAVPFFWNGPQKVRDGIMLSYLHLIYHQGHFFTIMLGANVGRWSIPGQTLYTVSGMLQFRLWLNLTPTWRTYLLVSIAGPSLISDRQFGGAMFSSNFLFQDTFGIGMQFGEKQAWHIEALVTHFSNGSIFPRNSGIQIPLLLKVGYSF